VARAGLFDVPGNERRPPRCRRALRLDIEPQLQRPPGGRGAHAPREPGDGSRGGGRRPLRRCPRIELRKDHEQFAVLEGVVAPLDRENVDTDAIIPKQFLKSIHRTGFGPHCFDEWRYLDPGYIGIDPASRKLDSEFELNRTRYDGASILLTRENFGCGSSREHAPWALEQYGIRVLVGSSFADIFFNNCFKNGLLPITLPTEVIDRLFDEAAATKGYRLTIDLEKQVVVTPSGEAIACAARRLITGKTGDISNDNFGSIKPTLTVVDRLPQ